MSTECFSSKGMSSSSHMKLSLSTRFDIAVRRMGFNVNSGVLKLFKIHEREKSGLSVILVEEKFPRDSEVQNMFMSMIELRTSSNKFSWRNKEWQKIT